MQCDAVLLNGNVIVNESMLTGESVPITKIPLGHIGKVNKDNGSSSSENDGMLNIKEHYKHVLFCGTQVIQTRCFRHEKVKAVVLRTGFTTTKGELVRSILHPKPVDFRFNADTYKYVGGLASIALVGMIFAIVIKVLNQSSIFLIIIRSLDIITIAVPPALPGALTAGLIYAQNRLRNQQVYCISPRTINISGSLNTFVFDKTGTLTEDGLDMKFVIPVKVADDGNTRYYDEPVSDAAGLNENSQKMLEGMTTCHSITIINGKIAGDPLGS